MSGDEQKFELRKDEFRVLNPELVRVNAVAPGKLIGLHLTGEAGKKALAGCPFPIRIYMPCGITLKLTRPEVTVQRSCPCPCGDENHWLIVLDEDSP